MSADGPEQRMADAREEYERDRDYKDAHEDSFEAWWDRQLARADHMLDQHKEIDLDSPEFAAMVDHFMQRVMR